MAAHDPRVRAVAAVSPPFSADVYWNVTLVAHAPRAGRALRHAESRRWTATSRASRSADTLPTLDRPLMVAGGGHDMITPGEEAYRIFEAARCERELVFYPRGAHDCFNVLADLRPRMIGWLARQPDAPPRRDRARPAAPRAPPRDPAWVAAEAVDPDFADELRGEIERPRWSRAASPGLPVDFAPTWGPPDPARLRVQVVTRLAAAEIF